VTDEWTGRKYVGIGADARPLEIISEPFKGGEIQYVAFKSGLEVAVVRTDSLDEGRFGLFRRIIEPKYKVGDRVVIGDDVYTIDAVSSKPDKDGEFLYILNSPEDIDYSWQLYIDRKADA